MCDLLSEEVSMDELKLFEKEYYAQLDKNEVTPKVQFEYAWHLVRSKYTADMKKGIIFLEELCKTHPEGRRDYIYYLAVGHARMKEYSKSLNYVKNFLSIEPGNQQVMHLQTEIKRRMDKEGAIGMAIAGGIVLSIGAIAALGMSLAGRKSKHK